MLTEKDYCDLDTSHELWVMGLEPEAYYDGPLILLYEAQKWMREVKKLHITIYSQSQESWQYRITKPHQRLEDGLHGEDFSSFEEALLHAIKECIEYVKQ